MVITGFSTQYSVFRKLVSFVQLSKFSMRVLKQSCLLLAFLNTEYWVLNTAQAKSLGVHGVIYLIEEVDPIALIHQKLKMMEESGDLEQRNVELQKKARASVEKPKPVERITKAARPRVFTFDPTYVVNEDLKDHQGQIFAKKGTKLNPLETVSLPQNLVFFNGDDVEQLLWVKEQLAQSQLSQPTKTKPLKLILTQGAPLKLAEELYIPVYFDQGGFLTRRLGIQHVPAVVSQEGLKLKIEEMVLPPSGELETEGAP